MTNLLQISISVGYVKKAAFILYASRVSGLLSEIKHSKFQLSKLMIKQKSSKIRNKLRGKKFLSSEGKKPQNTLEKKLNTTCQDYLLNSQLDSL